MKSIPPAATHASDSMPANTDRDTSANPTSPALAEGFVLLDNSTSLDAISELFEKPVEIIRADTPTEVAGALAALQGGLARGLHAAGFFSYELGYILGNEAAIAKFESARVGSIDARA